MTITPRSVSESDTGFFEIFQRAALVIQIAVNDPDVMQSRRGCAWVGQGLSKLERPLEKVQRLRFFSERAVNNKIDLERLNKGDGGVRQCEDKNPTLSPP